jgi:hypothetical protein
VGGIPLKIRRDNVLETQNVDVQEAGVTPATVSASTSGETTVVAAPGAGNKLRLYWMHIASEPDNGAKVTASLRFDTGGTDFVSVPLSQYGGVFAHSYKGGRSYYDGGENEALIVNLSAAQDVTVNVDYEVVAV